MRIFSSLFSCLYDQFCSLPFLALIAVWQLHKECIVELDWTECRQMRSDTSGFTDDALQRAQHSVQRVSWHQALNAWYISVSLKIPFLEASALRSY